MLENLQKPDPRIGAWSSPRHSWVVPIVLARHLRQASWVIGIDGEIAVGGHANDPRVGLVLHIHRELMHHGAEVGHLRDLYAAFAIQ
jgi:hypothetical protein